MGRRVGVAGMAAVGASVAVSVGMAGVSVGESVLIGKDVAEASRVASGIGVSLLTGKGVSEGSRVTSGSGVSLLMGNAVAEGSCDEVISRVAVGVSTPASEVGVSEGSASSPLIGIIPPPTHPISMEIITRKADIFIMKLCFELCVVFILAPLFLQTKRQFLQNLQFSCPNILTYVEDLSSKLTPEFNPNFAPS